LTVPDHKTENTNPRNSHWYIYGILLLLIFGAALLLRIIPMQNAVFGAGWVNMQGVDGIYHLRLVENLLAHFPFRINFDPYTFFPNGQDVYFAPLYDYLAAFCAWVVGLGSPDQHTIETVAAYFPAVLGALVTIPVYFIGKTLFNRKAGLLAALLVGILPGTILFRSRLGFFDHHVAEILFSTLIILFLLLALNQIKKHPVSFDNVLHKEWKILAMPLLFAALCGIALGTYLLVWIGGLLFVFILFCWAILMFVVSHLRKESTDYIPILGAPIFLIALLIVVPLLNQIDYSDLYVLSLVACLLMLFVLGGISTFLNSKNTRVIYFPLIILGLAVVGLAGLYFISPSLLNTVMQKFQIFNPTGVALTVAEEQPIFLSQGSFTLSRIWSEFNTAVIIAPIAFIMLIIGLFKNISNQKILLILWSTMVFLASAGQVRFASYLAVAFAVLCAYFYSEIIDWIYKLFRWLFSNPSKRPLKTQVHNKPKIKEQARKKTSVTDNPSQANSPWLPWYKLLAVSVSMVLVFFLGIYPNLGPALITAGTNAGIMSDWRSSLLWMKDNTPLPFQNDEFYYKLYDKPSDGKYIYPATAYGVLAWWDYGHMITEIAHRIPNSNPTQAGADSAARYFLAQTESSANQMLDTLGSKYVVIDFDVAIPYGVSNNTIVGKKFLALPSWANSDPSKYAEIYYQQKENRLSPVPVYYPEYYYSLVARLYNFHAALVVPNNSSTVISYTVQSGRKVIQSSQTFPTYEAAAAFLKKQTASNYMIVGLSPFSSPVPLEKLAHYNEVYRSSSGITYNNEKISNSYIEIFEYIP
jgi:dolichyl-phosphooligosaccharide-protein glycotransferase